MEQNYSTIEYNSFVVKKPGFYTVILVETHTAERDNHPFTIRYDIGLFDALGVQKKNLVEDL